MKNKNNEKNEDKELKTKELDQCTTAAHPEMRRNEDDEPCDDNRG